jgi:cytochrome c-type biogenesis protein CcmH/NrfG
MGKKEKEKEKQKGGGQYVKVETLVIVALVALVVGFFAGEIIDLSKSERPVPVQTSAPPQQPPQNRGPSVEQASRIFSLEKQVAANPANVEGWTELGNLYFDTGQFKKAIEAYKKSLEFNPNNASVWTDMGVMYRRDGQPFEAIAAFHKAMDVDPRHEVSRFNKGVVLMHDLDDLQGAIGAWEDLIAVNPSAKAPNGKTVKELVQKLKAGQNQQKSP